MRILHAALFATALLVFGQGANAACSRPVKVAFSEISPDMTLSSSGQHGGVAVEFFKELALRTGCTFTYVDVPRARAWYMLSNKLIDIVPAAIQNPERDDVGIYFDHVVLEPVSLILLMSKPVTIASSQEVIDSGLRLAVVRGHNYGPHFATLIANPALGERLAQVKDPQTLARMLKAGRVDAVITMASIFTDAAKEQGLTDQVYTRTLKDLDWGSTGMYLSNSRLPAEDVATLSAAIKALNQEGFYGVRVKQTLKGLPDWAVQGFRFQPLEAD